MLKEIPKAKANDPSKAGQLASRKVLFGDRSRYALYAVHTRFEAVQWFVTDAEAPDDLGLPGVLVQEDYLELVRLPTSLHDSPEGPWEGESA